MLINMQSLLALLIVIYRTSIKPGTVGQHKEKSLQTNHSQDYYLELK